MDAANEEIGQMDLQSSQHFAQLQRDFGDRLNEEMTSQVQAWESTQVNIAVIGETSVGKSSHINAHFGSYVCIVGHSGNVTQEVTPYGQTGRMTGSNPGILK